MSVMMQPPAIIFWSHGFFFLGDNTIQCDGPPTDALQYCIVFQKHKNFHCNLRPLIFISHSYNIISIVTI